MGFFQIDCDAMNNASANAAINSTLTGEYEEDNDWQYLFIVGNSLFIIPCL